MKFDHQSQPSASNNNGKYSKNLMSIAQDQSNELKNDGLNLLPNSVQSLESDELEGAKKGLNLRPIWRIIQRNALLILIITTAITTATLYSISRKPRVYEGNFRFLVEPITSDANFTDPSVLSRNENAATAINIDYPTLLQLLQSPSLLTKIAKRIQTQYPDFNNESLSQDLVNQNLVIRRVGTNLSDFTKLIEVRYRGKDPTQVQFILREILNEYLKYGLENRKTRISSGVEFIENQLPRLQQQVNNLQGQVQALQQRYKLNNPVNDGATLSQQLWEIQAQKFNVQRELREQKTLYVNLQKQLNLSENEALTASTLSEDPSYRELLAQQKNIERQIAVKSVQLTDDNPVMQSLREQQRNISLLLNQEAQRITGQALPTRVTNPQVLNFQNSTRQALIKQLIDTSNNTQLLEVRNQAVTKAEALLNQQLLQFLSVAVSYYTYV
ncbi:hypothetical protein LC605_29175 [Nostoc sp. CHAB 5836]|uniref:GumC family protein n=1 Tax=Nostoc sp. CHAB 5836 TaxID=2780404 RepID=UPI001E62D33E|nr:hypothetical protein [Nostoc sp. CHAB 5836]MCC5619081.1 hypothetical protein [Nostoc sp. CHAB 5836]